MSRKKNQQEEEFEELARVLEHEVQHTVETVTSAVQDVVRVVSESVRQNTAEGAQRLSDTVRSNFSGMRGQPGAAPPPQPFSQKNFDQQTRAGYNYQNPYYASRKQTEALYGTGGWLKNATGLTLPARRAFFGVMGSVTTFLAICFGAGVLAVATKGFINATFWAVLALMIASICTADECFTQAGLLRRFQQYLKVLEGSAFCAIKELAAATGQRPGKVRGDLKKILKKGWLRAACLSDNGKILFVDNMAYRTYYSRNPLEETEPSVQEEQAEPQQPAQEPRPADGLQDDGERFLQQLRREKALIDEAPVLEQVERIEQHTQSILSWVKAHPSSAGAVRRFTGYYLPTVLKLLRTYNEVDSHADGSTVASQIQSDIVGILYTVNTAFASLQDGLLQDTALDISAEISALETVLAQEGLTGSGLHTAPAKE